MPGNRDQPATAGQRPPLARKGCAWIGTLLAAVPLTAAAQVTMTNTYPISRYELRGNTALAPEATARLCTNAIGPAVPLGRICQTLASLRRAYQERGYLQVRISLPEQELTNGVVRVNVVEGDLFAGAIPPPAQTNQAPPMKFEVRRIEVAGNTLLPAAQVDDIVRAATGPAVTLEDIRQAATSLRHAYRERGYVTVAVTLPAQRLTNATVRLQVTEGKLASVQVVGNRHFSSEEILRAFPDLSTNTLLNSHIFQAELDAANQNRDRQIYPTLGPGAEPGTSALTLRVVDRLPFHAHLEADNYSTPGTPDLRVNAAAQYNNFWQADQQAGLAYSFTPQQYKTVDHTPDFGLNQPLVSSYSAFYRIPLQSGDTLGRQVAAAPAFGYQEATHQFLLPPAQAPAELLFYASASASDTAIKWGPPQTIASSNLLRIVSRDSEQSYANNANLGGQFRFPLWTGSHSRLAGFAGIDFKQAEMGGYSTNNFIITTVTTNQYGGQTNRLTDSKGQPSTHGHVVYFPVNAGLDYSETDAHGTTAGNVTTSANFIGQRADFAKLAYSGQAQALYGKAVALVSREENLPAGFVLLGRASGQAATGALISNEQFALGGINSVRGYYEGDVYGDSGWTATLELRSPYLQTGVWDLSRAVPAWLRASLFTDVGQRFLMAPGSDPESTLWLWGAGFGVTANINNHLDARMSIAWPFLPTPNTARDDVRANFSIGGQF